MVNRDNLLAWIDALVQIYAENKQFLTQLDSAIGDADHGINMDRGFQAVAADLAKTNPQDISTLLKTVAMALIRTVGGAAGPLYGTFFMRASATCANKAELGPADVVALFEAGLEGIVQRGKAELNDKTMVDAQKPALEAMKQALADGADVKTILQKGTAAAEEGMKNTIPLQARKGRASYLGERSIGHQDPGATSSYLMIKAAADLWA
ncbi:MAG: dihydroxyacetone kinase subunit L [Anaerolineales bacterium]|nr:dihydroxyacetone kinase subunit L [Anaerolineales bacterium]